MWGSSAKPRTTNVALSGLIEDEDVESIEMKTNLKNTHFFIIEQEQHALLTVVGYRYVCMSKVFS
jgi:hypothetical protein